MREMINLFMAVLLFSTVSGGLLAFVRNGTQDRITDQQLKFVKGPAIEQILAGCSNEPITDRFTLTDGDEERIFFIGEFDGKRNTVAFESKGSGFGGDIGVIVAVNVETDAIVGVAVTTHSETPGVGSRTKDDPGFGGQFKGLPIKDPFKVKTDGGQIDAVSGATVSSKGVCGAVTASSAVYLRLKDEIVKKL
jgi:electron transport complex protein RnfG